ncbi:MAG: helix-turn-helix domain-containing protein [Planctomycetes bacterium]|nr:helix-turn-helix domain-containing protein [Planctomycetota bacterium]
MTLPPKKAVLADLPATWRDKAGIFRDHAEEPLARAYEACAGDLEQALAEDTNATLTLSEAAEMSGLTADHLGRLVRQGKIHNAGRKGAPRIHRASLPGKLGLARQHEGPQVDRTQIVRSAINEGAG